ncbi:uncharacterized protein LOC113317754 isoform X1 [Papaver somniferum]|uniref:uncharacterized protein LOC113317754 isoform X1 n=2 Tax=Papaver somniferum TaxID=3469 RepID=UPI000E704D1B|nr:uncharacterized protein LOC113317754 isoform X1 [Papaver somniferum]
MNFLLRTAQTASPEQPGVQRHLESHSVAKTTTTLEGLIAEDPFPQIEDGDKYSDLIGGGGRSSYPGSSVNNQVLTTDNHEDVTEDEGWISIPYKELPDSWCDAVDINSFRPLDRSFVFPGEQIHILACLSASKKGTEIITPFRVAALMNKNGNNKQQNGSMDGKLDSNAEGGKENDVHQSTINQIKDENGESQLITETTDTQPSISASESILRMEDHKKQTETELARFKNSHFFVRIAESDELLWSKRSATESRPSELVREKLSRNEAGARKVSSTEGHLNAFVDRGNFDASVSGGVARDAVKCCSLSNGDIVVLLQVNVGVSFMSDPVLEVLQYEKHQDQNLASTKADNFAYTNTEDPCGELLKWLLPLNRTFPPPTRPVSPPSFSSTSSTSISSSTHKSGSQLFSHLRSYSMSSLPQHSTPPASVTSFSSKPKFDLEDWDRVSPQKSVKSHEAGNGALLSFRGIPLEPQRFSVHCGLEGIYIPGRRWRRKLEIIHPVEVRSFASDCNTEDFLCVQIKNVSPAHTPDLVVYLDAITVVFEEAPKDGPPLSLPIASIEAGSDHCLPNLALRRGEEHSFILKPATSIWRNHKPPGDRSRQLSYSLSASSTASSHGSSRVTEEKKTSSDADQYAVLVSCRCNYSESRLFFKQRTNWRPRVSRDLMISVASEMSEQAPRSKGGASKLPVQVLTLQASNLTSEDLTITVLAPASVTSPPSVVSLNSSPTTPMSPFVGFSEFTGRERNIAVMQRLKSAPAATTDNQKEKAGAGVRSVSLNEQTVSISDVIPTTGLGCTHLWLQSAVPLGCVPSQSIATVKLELLPLTDGIITLDTLQIHVKEKGQTYVPEHSLKINATSSVARGIS